MGKQKMIKIEKDIPIPMRVKVLRLYPLDKMAVGDSFFVPLMDTAAKKKFHGAVFKYGNEHGIKFSVRSIDGGVRCWRIA